MQLSLPKAGFQGQKLQPRSEALEGKSIHSASFISSLHEDSLHFQGREKEKSSKPTYKSKNKPKSASLSQRLSLLGLAGVSGFGTFVFGPNILQTFQQQRINQAAEAGTVQQNSHDKLTQLIRSAAHR